MFIVFIFCGVFRHHKFLVIVLFCEFSPGENIVYKAYNQSIVIKDKFQLLKILTVRNNYKCYLGLYCPSILRCVYIVLSFFFS